MNTEAYTSVEVKKTPPKAANGFNATSDKHPLPSDEDLRGRHSQQANSESIKDLQTDRDVLNQQLTNKTVEYTTLMLGENGRPRPLISVKDRKVNVNTFQVSMSRRHRIVMFLDLWTIAWVAGGTVFFSMADKLAQYIWITAPIGGFVLLCAIGKTIVDFQNWLYTMNMKLIQMGEWYMEDIVGICQDFISAGMRLAAEEVEKAKEEKPETEVKDADGEAANP